MKLFNELYRSILLETKIAPDPSNQNNQTSGDVWSPEKVQGLVVLVKKSLEKANPYFSYLLRSMPVKIVAPTSEIQTAAVDQYRNLYFNPVFVQQILDHYTTENENKVTGTDPFTYLVAHEIYHVVNRTFERQKGRSIMISGLGGQKSSLWNIATDFEMNDELSWRWGITPPIINGVSVGCTTDANGNAKFNGKTYNFRGKPAERIYNELAKDIPPGDGGDGGSGSGGSNPVIKPGSIVKGKGKDIFGEVVDIVNGEAIIKQISKEEAYRKAKSI